MKLTTSTGSLRAAEPAAFDRLERYSAGNLALVLGQEPLGSWRLLPRPSLPASFRFQPYASSMPSGNELGLRDAR